MKRKGLDHGEKNEVAGFFVFFTLAFLLAPAGDSKPAGPIT